MGLDREGFVFVTGELSPEKAKEILAMALLAEHGSARIREEGESVKISDNFFMISFFYFLKNMSEKEVFRLLEKRRFGNLIFYEGNCFEVWPHRFSNLNELIEDFKEGVEEYRDRVKAVIELGPVGDGSQIGVVRCLPLSDIG